MFGVKSVPEIFQKTLERILTNFDNCLNYIVDVTVFVSTEEEHDKAMKEVPQLYKEHNLVLNKDKCVRKTKN